MRVLCVTNIYPSTRYPASGVFIQQQIQGLRERGVDIDLLYVARRERGMRAYLGLKQRVRRRLAEIDPDLVHVMYGGIMAQLIIGAVKDWPVIVTFHGTDLLPERCAGWKRRLLSGLGNWASRQAAERASGVVVVSEVLGRALPVDFPPPKLRVMPLGIDLDRFRPLDRQACRQELAWPSNRFHVLFAGDPGNPIKRLELAWAAIKAAKDLGVDAELHLMLDVPNEKVPIWINASNVVLLTSEHEGSPTIIKEALACDLPVVSVDVGDVAERLQGIEGCYLARPEPQDIANKLLLVSKGPGRVKSRETMKELTLQRVAARLTEFYGEILENFKKEPMKT